MIETSSTCWTSRHLPRRDAVHVEKVLNEMGLRSGVTLDRVQPLFQYRGVAGSAPKNVRPAEYCTQRCAQFVR
jgi:hypothetical protein